MSAITEQQYIKLKADVTAAKADADRAQGALDQLMVRLKDEFECDTVKQTKAKLRELTEETEKAEKEFSKSLAEYERKWKEETE